MNLRPFFTHNAWWGKLIGGLLGYLMGGPTGALLGVLVGNFFDRGLAEHFSRPHWHYHAEKYTAVQKQFFVATFAAMGFVAKADGRVSEREIRMAKTLMQELSLNREQKKEAVHWFNAGKKSQCNLVDMLASLKSTSAGNVDLLKLFIDIQYRAAMVDGLSYKKIQAMNHILHSLGFAPIHEQPHTYYDFFNQSYEGASSKSQQRPQSPSSLSSAYALLEISPSAGEQEVKQAYRRLISRNHPDKLIAQGLPEELIKIANEKTQAIRKAYEQICSSQGW